jgi:pyruvate/2-oxoacid:ferredoxin oxidoreductase alpha subunit
MEQAKYTQDAFSAAIELLCLLMIASDLGLLSEEELGEIREKIEVLTGKLNGLRKYQMQKTQIQRNIKQPPKPRTEYNRYSTSSNYYNQEPTKYPISNWEDL